MVPSRVRIDDVMRQELACLIHHGNLAAGAQAGVNAQHTDGSSRGRKQDVLQVLAEHIDGIRVGAAFQFKTKFALDGRVQQALPAIFNGQVQLRRPVALVSSARAIAAERGYGARRFR